MQRRCKKCGYWKMLFAFNVADHKRGNRRHECKVCESERQKAYRAQNREELIRKKRSKWERWGRHAHAALRDEILSLLGEECACCGISERPFLTIDHVFNDGWMERKQYGQGLRGLRRIRAEIEAGNGHRFQTLCYNCNMGKKENNGICPHKEGSTTIPKGSRAKRPEVHRTPKGVMI